MHSIYSAPRRIVVTGMGVISPIASSISEFWSALITSRNAVGPAGDAYSGPESAAVWAGRCAFSGQIDEFGELPKATRKVVRKSLKLMNRETQLGVAAGQQALQHSGLLEADIDCHRIGICYGAANVSIQPHDFLAAVDACGGARDFDSGRWGRDGIPQVEPLWLLRCLPNMPSCHLAIINDLRGPNNCITQREAAANLAVAEAVRTIMEESADAVVVGGTGTLLQPVNQMHQSMEYPQVCDSAAEQAACRPFDLHRGPMIPAEGAAALVLEERQSALQRGAHIYGEVVGTAASCVIDRNGRPDPRAAFANTIRGVLSDAHSDLDEVGHLHAHGLGTRQTDVDEANAIHDVFGQRTDLLPVTAAKGHMGNSGAGGGAIELVASLLAMQDGRLFPVCNYRVPDPECPVRPVTTADQPAGDSFLSLSLHPRGLAAGVMIRRAA
jgi:3-oxoacyl-[acyl-carrier-protein] synthase II